MWCGGTVFPSVFQSQNVQYVRMGACYVWRILRLVRVSACVFI